MPNPSTLHEAEREVAFRKTFSGDAPFLALWAAEDFLAKRGFSYGSNQRGAPTGIMFGDWSIAKWRNLRPQEQAELHGVIEAGDHRNGPVTVCIYADAPEQALSLAREAA